MLANLLYLIATRSGPLSVVVTLASLYPASTVLLARVVLHERLSPRQWVGVACALIAVVGDRSLNQSNQEPAARSPSPESATIRS